MRDLTGRFLLISTFIYVANAQTPSQSGLETVGVRFSRDLDALDLWDAVTGEDEYGDLVTTFMHKDWGTVVQIFHVSSAAQDERQKKLSMPYMKATCMLIRLVGLWQAAKWSYIPFRFIPNLRWISENSKGRAQAMHL